MKSVLNKIEIPPIFDQKAVIPNNKCVSERYIVNTRI
jgi:hypothetical protein